MTDPRIALIVRQPQRITVVRRISGQITGGSAPTDASQVAFNGTQIGEPSVTNVRQALVALDGRDAYDLPYDPTISGMSAVTVGAAIDALDFRLDNAVTPALNDLDGRLDGAAASITTLGGRLNGLAAGQVAYNDTATGLGVVNVQTAIVALDTRLDGLVASQVAYNDAGTGLGVVNVQTAIVALDARLDGLVASQVPYNDTGTNLGVVNVQTAIVALDTRLDGLVASQVAYNDSTTGLGANTVQAALVAAVAQKKSMPGTLKGCEINYNTGVRCAIQAGSVVDNNGLIWTNNTTVFIDFNITFNGSGTPTNGLDVGSLTADTWYHVWMVRRTADNVIAFCATISSGTPALPSGWTSITRLESRRTGATATLDRVYQWGEFAKTWSTAIDSSLSAPATAARTLTLMTPPNRIVMAQLQLTIDQRATAGGTDAHMSLVPISTPTPAGAIGQAMIIFGFNTTGFAKSIVEIPVNNQQVQQYTHQISGVAEVRTMGWRRI